MKQIIASLFFCLFFGCATAGQNYASNECQDNIASIHRFADRMIATSRSPEEIEQVEEVRKQALERAYSYCRQNAEYERAKQSQLFLDMGRIGADAYRDM